MSEQAHLTGRVETIEPYEHGKSILTVVFDDNAAAVFVWPNEGLEDVAAESRVCVKQDPSCFAVVDFGLVAE